MLSIITINYNNAAGLSKTIESVLSQTYQDIQYIIIDGGSTDDSVEVIRKQEEKINYWISEKDRGIYHAQNKGIQQANGDYLLFLNSGDYLLESTTIAQLFDHNFHEDIVYGDLYFDNLVSDLILKEYPSKLTFNYFFVNGESLPHPSALIKKSLFEKVGLYNEDLKIISDWEFWLKAIFLHQATYKKIDQVVTVFSLDGISSKQEFVSVKKSEAETVYRKYFSGIVPDYEKYNALKQIFEHNRFIKICRRLKLINDD